MQFAERRLTSEWPLMTLHKNTLAEGRRLRPAEQETPLNSILPPSPLSLPPSLCSYR